ncbi:hypothetical protein [Pseudomonas lopnurensis]|uniref:hypothetical protein n=1 Tax=Pseudomonas lopnurensis TaxID=1477517 RepID=UPI00187AE4B8|nr:hypothetical protein [Pseudomonas lopnurensis]MBE7373918.1 hypothetical protein [Pseudomonas lopnurensis]
MHIESSRPLNNLARSVQRQASAAERTPEALRQGLRVSLSELGRSLSAKAGEKNRDIDESGLPDSIKQLLKMIRELKAQIAAKEAELKALMADRNLDPEARRLKVEALQSELAMLNGAWASANASLITQMHEQGLGDEQMLTATSLAIA